MPEPKEWVTAKEAALTSTGVRAPYVDRITILIVIGVELIEWQELLLRAHGFLITDQEQHP